MLHKPLFRGKRSRGDGLPRPVEKKDPLFLRMSKFRKGRLIRSTPTPTALVGSPSRSLGITQTLGDRGPSPGQGSLLQKEVHHTPPAAPNQPMSGLRPQPAARTHNFVGAGQFKEGLERPKSRVQPLKGQVSENSGKSAGQAGLRKDNQ